MKKLFESTSPNGLELKNRFIRSATWEGIAEENGYINDTVMNLYEDLAKGGAAAIITGYAFVLEEEQPNPRMFGIYNNSFVDVYKPLTEMVHTHDSKIVLQIVYGGSFTWHDVGKRTIWGPSAIENKITGVTPVEMTPENIQTLISAFGDAAKRAMSSGFDGVEIHAGHGYLLNQFLSPFFNHRTDNYGGNSDNRARIIFEIYDDIKAKTSADYPVMIKLNCSDFMGNKGFVFEECRNLCKLLSDKGITAIEISGGPVFRAPKTEKEPTLQVEITEKDSYFSEYAKHIANDVNCPVILIGGNRSLETMERLLNETDIEYFSFSRPLLSEPDLINKWEKDSTVKPRCTSCNKCFGADYNMCILNREKQE